MSGISQAYSGGKRIQLQIGNCVGDLHDFTNFVFELSMAVGTAGNEFCFEGSYLPAGTTTWKIIRIVLGASNSIRVSVIDQ